MKLDLRSMFQILNKPSANTNVFQNRWQMRKGNYYINTKLTKRP